jgi:hypothetical protein
VKENQRECNGAAKRAHEEASRRKSWHCSSPHQDFRNKIRPSPSPTSSPTPPAPAIRRPSLRLEITRAIRANEQFREDQEEGVMPGGWVTSRLRSRVRQ